MKLFSQPKSTLLASLLGGLSAFALGCVITVGETGDAGAEEECGDLLTHSYQDGDQCFCEIGYDWCTNNLNDYDCCKIPPKNVDQCDQPNNEIKDGECYCAAGYTWCSDDANDFSCCESNQGENTGGSESGTGTGTDGTDSTSETGGTTDAETGGMICEAQDPVDPCDPADEIAFCTTITDECVGESEYYTCDAGGSWQPADGTEECEFSGYDFTYGCVDTGDAVEQLCGTGPGTPCSNNDPDSCSDGDTLNYCTYGKLGATSCLQQCQEIGDDRGIQYDFGSCGEQEGAFKCLCCDLDEEGCGLESGGTDGTTGGTTGA